MAIISRDDKRYLSCDLKYKCALAKRGKEIEEDRYCELLKVYSGFISDANSLLNDIAIKDNSISKAYLIGTMVRKGIFSYGSFEVDTNDYYDKLTYTPATEIVSGRGCCKHFSALTKDIFDVDGTFCEIFYCKSTDTKSNESLKFTGNHSIDIIRYSNEYYGYDSFNQLALDFISPSELKSLECDRCMYYKPNQQIWIEQMSLSELKRRLRNYRSSIGSTISCDELFQIRLETDISSVMAEDKIEEFKMDTLPQKENIYRLMMNS